MARVARCGAGGVTSKSCGPRPRTGHPNPTVLDWGPGLINAVGLANPGVEAEGAILRETKARLRPLGVPLIASIFAETVEGFGDVARKVSAAEPDLIEVNISCPNVAAEFGRPFALDAQTAAAVTRTVGEATSIPITVKLSPNTPDLVPIARAVVEAGADALTAVNTVGPGMVIDLESGSPILANRVGGVSGPADFSFEVSYPVSAAQLGHLEVFEVDASEGEGFPPGRSVIPLVLMASEDDATGGGRSR